MSDSPSPASSSVFSRSPEQGATPSSQPAWSEVTALGDSRHRLRLGGFFGPAWMAQLCCTLAERKLSIERAHALRARNQSWMAELTVCDVQGSDDPLSLPFARLDASLNSQDLPALVLDGFELAATEDHGGSLLLTIHAHDTLGLLGSLLAGLHDLGLFPIEMHIDTRQGLVHDRMWLGGSAGSVPDGGAEQALRSLLSSAVSG